ncbi:divergent polysaccharide deacetylase family protein [Cohnella sp. CFH 77786]|uniref:divergent polysaccharide deacetylase family protein n=1 Tax=Cohnella sp. CFH 77786 TaxID=2662265 RepID=UPI001C609ACD|nr:divergent polysaccharide deacetylase family protein [Cohnella sp. CFH 77786]MBW5445141.1 divergent polysaccharide deacetylase family protein [Cohnella sp. CFH 77786]
MLKVLLLLLAAWLGWGQGLAQAHPVPPDGSEPPQASARSRHIAVVIDDFGNGMKGTEEMLKLPVKVTVAVMPFLPTTRKDAETAHAMGHDVLIHLPMEPLRGKASWLGPGAILTRLSDEEIRRRVEAAIADVPYAVGMNNHMGSKATSDERVMRIVLQVCKEKGLFFLDSRTSWRTVIPKVARELGVPLLQNDVFLDDVYTRRHVSRQLSVLRKELKKRNTCVVIGHVGPPGLITSGELKNAIPALQSEATFVRLSELIPAVSRAQGAKQR